jgi:[NiFe] hydrogenase diaphorase moiety large subunit
MSTRQSERPDAGPNPAPRADIKDICASFGNDRHRMLDILLCVQEAERQISADAIRTIAAATGASPIEVEGVASFYAFLSLSPKGRVTIRLCDDIIDRHAGLAAVQAAFEAGLGIAVGQTIRRWRLFAGMHAVHRHVRPGPGGDDQRRRAYEADAREGARDRDRLKAGSPPEGALIDERLRRSSPHAQARAMVENNMRHAGDVLLGPMPIRGRSEGRAGNDTRRDPRLRRGSGLRGCGGAGLPAGPSGGTRRRRRRSGASSSAMPTRASRAPSRTVVLLTERPHLMFEGMTIAARAVGAREGISICAANTSICATVAGPRAGRRRRARLLGRDILGVAGFDFDIRIQMGAGRLCLRRGRRADQFLRRAAGRAQDTPALPHQRGYLGYPTIVNNVETFCHAARILDRGAEWFFAMGTEGSHGTKLFSVCGDCARPGSTNALRPERAGTAGDGRGRRCRRGAGRRAERHDDRPRQRSTGR